MELYRNDREEWKRGGGVAIYFKKHFKCKVLSKSVFSFNCCEFLLCELSNKHGKLLVGCVYKPPNCSSIDIFYEQLQIYATSYEKIVIGGDFNLDLLKQHSVVDKHKSQMHSFGLVFVNTTQPTHFQTTPTLLDHFLVSDSIFVHHYQQLLAPGYSKHDAIFLIIEFPIIKQSCSTCSYRNFRAINIERLSSDILGISWTPLLYFPLDYCVQYLEEVINKLFDAHVPMVTKTISSTDNPWMTLEIRNLRKQRDAAFSKWKQTKQPEHRESFNRLRNLVTSKIKTSKTNFYVKKLDPRQPARVLWKQLRQLGIAEKPQISCEVNPNTLINSFFPSSTSQQPSEVFVSHRSTPTFDFLNVSTDDVIIAFHSITSNVIGLDGISLRFIKIILPELLNILTIIFNRCINENYFPTSWKIAKVIAVPKKCGNEFRPISILPCFSKVY